jgi:hypothetical protein
MNSACSTHGRDEKCVQNFGQKTWKRSDHLEDLGIDGRILLKWIPKLKVNCIHMA